MSESFRVLRMPDPWRRAAAAATAIALLALPACGAEEPGPSERPAGGEAAENDRPQAREGSPSGGAQPERPEEADEAEEPAACTFDAPPGRLGEDTIVLDLDGVACEQAVRAARAVALGQPAGANLVVRSAGLECEPSTREKGANATYTCSGDGGQAAFDVIWSAGGP